MRDYVILHRLMRCLLHTLCLRDLLASLSKCSYTQVTNCRVKAGLAPEENIARGGIRKAKLFSYLTLKIRELIQHELGL